MMLGSYQCAVGNRGGLEVCATLRDSHADFVKIDERTSAGGFAYDIMQAGVIPMNGNCGEATFDIGDACGRIKLILNLGCGTVS